MQYHFRDDPIKYKINTESKNSMEQTFGHGPFIVPGTDGRQRTSKWRHHDNGSVLQATRSTAARDERTGSQGPTQVT